MAKHGPEQTRPPVDKVIAALKETGVTSFGGTGYCLGGEFASIRIGINDPHPVSYSGRYVFDLAFENIIKVSAVSHPTFLQVPTDLEVRIPSSLLGSDELNIAAYSEILDGITLAPPHQWLRI